MKKRLIEWNLPLAEISEESAREKNIRHGHPSTLHIWWARRPLASSRATAFAALIDDPGEENPEQREYLMDLIRRITPWEAVKDGNSEAIEEARKLIQKQYGRPPRVLDPFAGGGSIPLEALRLGCETSASDYNPVAVLIEKATLEWPQKFGIEVELPRKMVEENQNDSIKQLPFGEKGDTEKVNLLAYLVDKWANIILEESRAEIGRFYPPDPDGWIPVGYLWARTIPCNNPSCGVEIPLIKQFWLAIKENTKIAYRPLVNATNKQIDFEVLENSNAILTARFDPGEGTITTGDARCLVCGQITKAHQIRTATREGKMGARLLLVILHHPLQTGKRYRVATMDDEQIYLEASAYLGEKLADWPYLESPLPDEPIPTPDNEEYKYGNLYYNFTPVVLYGLTKWSDLYNHRQKLSLITFMEKIKSNHSLIVSDCDQVLCFISANYITQITADNLAKAVMGYLGIMLSRLVDFNSTLCLLNSVGGRGVVHTFGRQALSMTWDYMETNVFNPEGASWYAAIEQTAKVLKASLFHNSTIFCSQRSATQLEDISNDYLDAVFTDPPYYDNVPYAALSDYFYVWLKRAIGDIIPDLFSIPISPKKLEAIAELPLLRGMNKNEASKKLQYIKTSENFESLIRDALLEIRRTLKPSGILVIVYAHKTTEGWETMLNSLIGAGFVVTGSWPIHTEKKGRLREIASAALASSIYMVCRKQVCEPLGFWNELQPIILARVQQKLAQFWDEGIAGGDFFISAIGPGMEEYSKYERVETYSGEPIGVDKLLHFIRQVSTDFLVNRLLKHAQRESIDPEAQFYLTYRWTFLENKVPFDDANKIARAEGIDLEQYWAKGGFVKKSGSDVEVLGPHKRVVIEEVENMVDAMHRACQLWERGQKVEITRLLAARGYAESGAFWQFCQAVAECLINGSKEKQLLEGLLMGKDVYIRDSAEVVAEMKKTKPKQPRLFE